jgi:hypothetical protein
MTRGTTTGRANGSRRRSIALRLVVPVLGFLALGLFCLLYRYETAWYFRILTAAFPYPFDFPFLDGRFILATRECWQRGIDVYTVNPCDPLNQLNNYSPLLLRLSILPGAEWANWLGLAFASFFLVSLAYLPPARDGRELAVIAAATLSPTTAFVLERANIDLIVFIMAVAATLCLQGRFLTRGLGYCAILVAGLLKYYPFVLLLLMLRERLPRFLLLAGAAAAVIIGFGWYFHAELAKAAANLPSGYFSNGFGAVEFPGGFGEVLKAALNAVGVHTALVDALPQNAILRHGLRIALTAVSVALALRLAGNFRAAPAIGALPERHGNYLLTGAILISGCFFAGHNVGYRGIFLLFTLPALLALRGDEKLSRVAYSTLGAAVFNMWSPPLYHVFLYWWRHDPEGAGALIGRYVYWGFHEFIWWWMATVFLALVLAVMARAPSLPTLSAAFPWVRVRIVSGLHR